MRFNAVLPGLPAALFAAGIPFIAATHAASDPSADGGKLFATSCGWCHSQGGRAAGKGPKLAGTERSDAFIASRIKTGKQGAMPGFARTLNDAQIAQIVNYIRSLKDE
jgi:mono/diheme cytochrome c family protein